MTIRMFPPALPAAGKSTTVNGRTWTAAPGSFVDVPNGDGHSLEANGWIRPGRAPQTGTTAQRPVVTAGGANPSYNDSTVGALIFWDGAAWRNAFTGAAV